MAEIGSCPISVQGIGIKGCLSGNPLKMPHKVVLAVPGFSFDTYSDFIDEDVVNAAIAAKNLFPLETIVDIEDTSSEDTEVESGNKQKHTTQFGKRGFTAYMNCTLKQNEYLKDFGGIGWTIYIVGIDGSWEGQTPDGITVAGHTTSRVDFPGMMRSWDTAQISRTPIKIEFDDNDEMDKKIVLAKAADLDWYPKKITPLTLVLITNATFDTNELTGTFNVVNDRSAVVESSPIISVATSNISVTDQAGDPVVPSDATSTIPGIWLFTATANGMTAGTIELIPSADSLVYSEVTNMVSA